MSGTAGSNVTSCLAQMSVSCHILCVSALLCGDVTVCGVGHSTNG